MSIPGIARRTASVVITDMPEHGSLGRKAAASLAVLAPHPDQSGPTPGRNAIADGRSCLGTASYMAGMVAAPLRPAFPDAIPDDARRRKARDGATGRRLATLANALVRDDKAFAESRLAELQRDAREI